MIALALLWQTVRHELEWWGYARYTALNPLELETESVVEELWTVNGDGRESISIELAPGLWTIELINPPAATDRTSVNLDGRQWGIGWTSTSAQAMRMRISAFQRVRWQLSVDTDGAWTVLLEPVPCP